MARILISGIFGDDEWKLDFCDCVAQSLEGMGHEVFRYNALTRRLPGYHPFSMIERVLAFPVRLIGGKKEWVYETLPWHKDRRSERGLLKAAQAFQPDTVIVISLLTFSSHCLKKLRRLHKVNQLIGWCVEGPNWIRSPFEESGLYDRYFAINRNITDQSDGKIEYLPAYGRDSSRFHPIPRQNQDTRKKVVFVGQFKPRRAELIASLLHLDVEIHGPGWDKAGIAFSKAWKGTFIWGEDLNRLYNQAAIILNITFWNPLEGGNTQRIVDVPSSGALLLTDDNDEIRTLFKIDEEVVTFRTPEDLRNKVEFYLCHVDERDRIAQAGYEAALRIPGFSYQAGKLIDRPAMASPGTP